MQNTTPPASSPATAWIAIYGLFILSLLAIVLIGLAWLLGRVDANTAINVVILVLGGNGLITATQWQAAPGLATSLQTIFDQLIGHIQTLHSQAAAQQAPQLATTKLPAVQVPAAPAPVPQPTPQPVPQQAFPTSPAASFLGQAPLTAQTWQPSSPLRTGTGG